jgi:hypothetical protein
VAVTSYEQMILNGIKGLSPEALEEIIDFVYFIRRKTFSPGDFEEEMQSTLSQEALIQFNKAEEQHLIEEFADYAERYPRE